MRQKKLLVGQMTTGADAVDNGNSNKEGIHVASQESRTISTKKEITRRNRVITLMALYDAVETGPGQWRPYTLDEIGNHFGITRERVRQIINVTGDPYPLILKRRARRKQLYKKALAALKRNRTLTVYKRGPRKGRARPEYLAYRAMLQRVFDSKNPNYPRYGGRGITVHETWLGTNGYQRCFADLGPRPPRKHGASNRAVYSLHRINNAMIYSAATTKWATSKGHNDTASGQRRRPTRVQHD